jgi:hypothetical protein
VPRHHHHLADIEALLDIAHHHRGGVEIVGRDIEESLDLAGVKVECHDPVGAGATDQVGHELGRDRGARCRLAVLPGVTEIGNDGGDAPPRRAA